jgi:hypothetical protein
MARRENYNKSISQVICWDMNGCCLKRINLNKVTEGNVVQAFCYDVGRTDSMANIYGRTLVVSVADNDNGRTIGKIETIFEK